MKTRIISGAVMIIAIAAVLTIGLLWAPWLVTGAVALIAAIGIYELLHNAAGITNKLAVLGAMVYTLFAVYASISGTIFFHNIVLNLTNVTAIYFLYAVVVLIYYHDEFSIEQLLMFAVMPTFVNYAFISLGNIIHMESGIYYLLMLINFSSVCDTGAYFVGTIWGKRKLCPAISPKKTVEGAIGGIISSFVVTIILALCFGRVDKLLLALVLTVPFCMIGMLGDLFASVIKRKVGIKDYGSLIPGHGGVLDRVDSILLIAPMLYMYASFGVF